MKYSLALATLVSIFASVGLSNQTPWESACYCGTLERDQDNVYTVNDGRFRHYLSSGALSDGIPASKIKDGSDYVDLSNSQLERIVEHSEGYDSKICVLGNLQNTATVNTGLISNIDAVYAPNRPGHRECIGANTRGTPLNLE